MNERLEEDCADAYSDGEAVAKEHGHTLWELPSLTYHMHEDGELATWLDLHPAFTRGSKLRHLVAQAMQEAFAASGWDFVDDGDHWEEEGGEEGGGGDAPEKAAEEVKTPVTSSTTSDVAEGPEDSPEPAEGPVPLEVIAAADGCWGIGKDGGLPWPASKADMRKFVEVTRGKTVIMGRKTAESIPAEHFPLKGRTNIVVTSRTFAQAPAPGVIYVESPATALEVARKKGAGIVVIGGSELYTWFLPDADVLHLSRTDKVFDCDTFFPALNPDGWEQVASAQLDADWTYGQYLRVQRDGERNYIKALAEAPLYRVQMTVLTRVDPRSSPIAVQQFLGTALLVGCETEPINQERVDHGRVPDWPLGLELSRGGFGSSSGIGHAEIYLNDAEVERVTRALRENDAWKELFAAEWQYAKTRIGASSLARTQLWTRTVNIGLFSIKVSLSMDPLSDDPRRPKLYWEVWQQLRSSSFMQVGHGTLEGPNVCGEYMLRGHSVRLHLRRKEDPPCRT